MSEVLMYITIAVTCLVFCATVIYVATAIAHRIFPRCKACGIYLDDPRHGKYHRLLDESEREINIEALIDHVMEDA